MKQNFFKAVTALALSSILITCCVNAAAEFAPDNSAQNAAEDIKPAVTAAEKLPEVSAAVQPAAAEEEKQPDDTAVCQVPL
ncbi:MAG: hypothetical protein NC228_09565, partial [[Eubacterium] siraeum]|nr:hypothetical protein [[Eubacterium] siraeum]